MVKRFKLYGVIGALALVPSALYAQVAATEYEIKAAFLYNFAKFVEWPAEAFQNSGDSFVIGIVGKDPFAAETEKDLEGKTVQERKLVVKRLENIHEGAGCHVVFISRSEEGNLKDILSELKGPPVLTVSDMPRFVQHGGMVGFALEHNKVRFSINRTVAEESKLKISSQLLKLAKTIVKTLLSIPIG